ncbi:hypothetical protein J5N97_018060 [Dioscorea zingiberensis]|uniref:Uncharacterized protein n=1 Tax=Dioscorea zingiberensis TaxID=325984 RepID=A0A9D5HGZ2_9LILI|nr:hypothetical protein J5N97_018060 [Dioscorea zingiberensis]
MHAALERYVAVGADLDGVVVLGHGEEQRKPSQRVADALVVYFFERAAALLVAQAVVVVVRDTNLAPRPSASPARLSGRGAGEAVEAVEDGAHVFVGARAVGWFVEEDGGAEPVGVRELGQAVGVGEGGCELCGEEEKSEHWGWPCFIGGESCKDGRKRFVNQA